MNSGKIEKYNVPKGCCAHQYCSTHATYYVNWQIGKIPVQLVFYKKHFDEFMEANP